MDQKTNNTNYEGMPERPVDRFLEPLTRFLHIESASGIVLVVATVIALALANSPFADVYLKFWKIPVAGMVTSVWKNVNANWIPYVKVQDLDRSVQLVQELGGTIVLKPAGNRRKAVLISDPTGAVLGLQQWPE